MSINFAQVIKERVSSREMMEAVGVSVDRRGMAECPFHCDGDASLKVYSDPRRGWHCYGCHAGGDVIDFVTLWHGVNFREAMSIINDMFGIGLPIGKQDKAQMRAYRDEIEQRRKERERRQEVCDEAEKAYWSAYEAWLANESILASERPTGPFEDMSEAFMHAVTHREEIKDTLNLAEERWRACRERLHDK